MITIVDYNTGNLGSIKNMLSYLGIESKITNKKEDIERAEKLILPGVGHFDYGMQQLQKINLISTLNKKVLEEKIPILGICLGVQLFMQMSEEGVKSGLGWIQGKSVLFNKSNFTSSQKLPNMGWAEVTNCNESKLLNNMPSEPRFYFAHSYHLELENKNDCVLTSKYGYEFAAAIEHENILGVQFHPEKSHKYGMKLLENFVKLF